MANITEKSAIIYIHFLFSPAKEASYPNKNISPDILRKNISICGVWCRAIFCTRERRAVRIICCSESWHNWRYIERRFTQEEQYSNSPEFNILRIHTQYNIVVRRKTCKQCLTIFKMECTSFLHLKCLPVKIPNLNPQL